MNAEPSKDADARGFHRRAAAPHPETRMLIDGRLVEAQSGRRFETVSPANGAVIAAVPSGDAGEVDLAVAAARRARKSGIWWRLEPRSQCRRDVVERGRTVMQSVDEAADRRAVRAAPSPPAAGGRGRRHLGVPRHGWAILE
jgi:hypothetical protein